MVQAARFSDSFGGIYWQSSAPDVATYPDLARCIWGKLVGGESNSEFYYWDGSTWQLLFVLDGEDILSGTIEKEALALTDAYKGLFMNAAGTAWEYKLPQDAFVVNSLPINKLVYGTANQVLLMNGTPVPTWSTIGVANMTSPGAAANVRFLQADVAGAISWAAFSPSSFANNSIAVAKITAGTTGYIIGSVGGVTVWGTPDTVLSEGSIPVAKLVGGSNGQVLGMSGGDPTWIDSNDGNDGLIGERYDPNNTAYNYVQGNPMPVDFATSVVDRSSGWNSGTDDFTPPKGIYYIYAKLTQAIQALASSGSLLVYVDGALEATGAAVAYSAVVETEIFVEYGPFRLDGSQTVAIYFAQSGGGSFTANTNGGATKTFVELYKLG